MTDRSTGPAPDRDRAREHLDSNTGTPRWVKVFAIVGAALVLLAAVLLLLGGGEHGPGRHASVGGTVPSSAAVMR